MEDTRATSCFVCLFVVCPNPFFFQLLRRLAAASPRSSATAPEGGGGAGCNGGANGSKRTPSSDDEAAVFSELTVQLDKAEDGLLAGAHMNAVVSCPRGWL